MLGRVRFANGRSESVLVGSRSGATRAAALFARRTRAFDSVALVYVSNIAASAALLLFAKPSEEGDLYCSKDPYGDNNKDYPTCKIHHYLIQTCLLIRYVIQS